MTDTGHFRPGWGVGRRLLRWLASAAITVAVFYLLAGRWDLPWLWVTAAAGSLLTLALTLTIDPDLARERRRPGPGGLDRATRAAMVICLTAEMVVSVLDVGRFHWSDTVPLAGHALGLAVFTAGFGLVTWAVAVNRFFSSVVRVQAERGHEIVTTGPYRYLRHPGYLGMLLGYSLIPLAIGSWWGLLPGAGCALVVLRRTRLEDRYLQGNFAGYGEYVARVPYRLVPGVW